MGIFISPRARIPGSRRLRPRIRPRPITTGTSESAPSATPPTAPRASVNNKNQIIRIVNNYARISFNFGPTLLSWLKENAPRTYRMILDGERRSRKTFQGHSSAMAQVYNHVIMPLANERDKITQIRWGIADYKSHYGAMPEGMWLAETAADTETLELLAQARNQIHSPCAQPVQARPASRGRRNRLRVCMDHAPRQFRRHNAALSGAFRLWRGDYSIFLRRRNLARNRF